MALRSTMSTEQQSLILSVFPPEITQRIFGHCLLPQYGPRGPLVHRFGWSPSPREAPLLLAQICRQWRDICIESPNLWTSVGFDEKQPIEYLLTSLERAGDGVPLSLRIRASSSTAAIAMDLIIPYIHRWQRVHLILPVAELIRLHMHHCPLLEQLTLSAFEKETSQLTNPTLIQSAPLLSYADATNFPNLELPGRMNLLTILRIRAWDASQAMATLRLCPNLLDLACDYRNPYPHSFILQPPEPFELASLRILKVTDDQMLPFLITPNLERLHLHYTSRHEDNAGIPSDALGSFLARSGCDLLFLSMNGKRILHQWYLANLLHHANSVRHLRVTVADGVDVSCLMWTIAMPDCLPRLVHLEVRDPAAVIYPNRGQYDAMLEMLSQRQKHTSLERMELFLGRRTVGGPRTPPAAVMRELRGLEKIGLQVRITARNRPTSSSYVDVSLFDNFVGSAVEYAYIPPFEL
ncbi:hypothetical protein B0H16DRAFT_1601387 [Mycena metata]|uniref:F-box domain-containing protein n=1 Tax=Mycena metata TaxID=1033252 RepID=A0AAD7MLR8_9AGAR|nr:hypothetical protein B0H16DRAFT_1601387 [Mycena metata]